MKAITIYRHCQIEGFRIVAGEHKHSAQELEHSSHYAVTVFQGSTIEAAAQAAISVETREDIKTQLQRFLAPEGPATRTVDPSFHNVTASSGHSPDTDDAVNEAGKRDMESGHIDGLLSLSSAPSGHSPDTAKQPSPPENGGGTFFPQAWEIIWPEKRWVNADDIRNWYSDAVANQEYGVEKGLNDPDEMARNLHCIGTITLGDGRRSKRS